MDTPQEPESCLPKCSSRPAWPSCINSSVFLSGTNICIPVILDSQPSFFPSGTSFFCPYFFIYVKSNTSPGRPQGLPVHSDLPNAITPWMLLQCWKDLCYCCDDATKDVTQKTTRWHNVRALLALICHDLCGFAEISLISRVAMSPKYSQYPTPVATSLAPSNILLISRPN